MPPELPLTVLLTLGLAPALLLYRRYKRPFTPRQELAINLAAGFAALLPVALTRLELVQRPIGVHAIAYFLVYIVGLALFNHRHAQRRGRHGR